MGCLLTVGLLFSAPSFAFQQDSLAQDTTVSAASDTVEEGQADTAATATTADTTATAEGGEAAAATTTSKSSSSSSATVVDEGPQIDPQVYKNMTYYILLFLIVCTVVAVVGKVLSIYELTRKMNGRYNPFANNTFQSVLMVIFLVAFLGFVYYGYAVWGDWAWRSAVTEHGERIDTMFIITTVIITIVLVLVHILLLTFPYIYRMRKGTKAYYYPHNDTIEKIWTIVPAIVLTVLVLFGFFTWRSITNVPEDLQKSAIQVEVLGEQFQWQVRYPGADGVIGKRNYKLTTPINSYGIDFNDKHAWDDIQASDIVIPVNKSVRFHIISKDIIHSFYIPDFRVQINAVPGMTNYFQFTPTMTTEDMREKMNDPKYDFIMLCNKICGSGHYNMQKKVIVVTEEEYKEWLSTQNKYFTEDLQKEFAAANSEESKEFTTASLN
ncbi:cytochrome c oxidase subunit II [Sphingobacterium sp. SGR-19]|nr:cytochrome c oxidase subunit II [Sphingobacterium sp. SGR-19]